MYRKALLGLIALSVALPRAGHAQTSADERARAAQERAAERQRVREERDREKEEKRRERERASSLDTVVAFDARGVVIVSCPGGMVTVTGGSRNEIRVHARTENGAIRFTASGMRATLEPSSAGGCSDGKFEITIPATARVTATTWSGEAKVRGVHGDVEVHSQSGEVDVRDVDRVDVESLSGDVTIAGVKGDASVHTVSGEIQMSGTRGNVVVETISGDIGLRDVISKSVRAHSSSSEITFQGTIADAGRYEFNTHSGEIMLFLPTDLGAGLSLSTFNGGIESDFPITLQAGPHGIGSSQAKRLNFTVGKGTARIVAETFSGDITLKRGGRKEK